jgi:hypothetical protein
MGTGRSLFPTQNIDPAAVMQSRHDASRNIKSQLDSLVDTTTLLPELNGIIADYAALPFVRWSKYCLEPRALCDEHLLSIVSFDGKTRTTPNDQFSWSLTDAQLQLCESVTTWRFHVQLSINDKHPVWTGISRRGGYGPGGRVSFAVDLHSGRIQRAGYTDDKHPLSCSTIAACPEGVVTFTADLVRNTLSININGTISPDFEFHEEGPLHEWRPFLDGRCVAVLLD